MDNIEKILRESWNSIDYYNGGSLQLGLNHPLEWHVSYETANNKALVIITQYPINHLESSKSIMTLCNKRTDGSYYISFQLTEHSQEDVFMSMCTNLIEYSENALGEKDAVKKVGERYKQWRRLMEHKYTGVLSDEKRRGLIGELRFLQYMLRLKQNNRRVLAGWVGPDGADQDFAYNSVWYEIKTTGEASDKISIHSFEQLGNKNDTGELWIYRVDPCAPETNGAFTLRSLVSEIRKSLNGDYRDIDLFYQKLSEVGYIDQKEYESYSYKCYRCDVYNVDNKFPRITRDMVADEIVKCEYTLSIPTINSWKKG